MSDMQINRLLAEMRAMAYLGLAHGSPVVWTYGMVELMSPRRGWQYWSPESRAGSEWQWHALSGLAQELKRIGPALAAGTAPPETITATASQSCQSIDLIKKTLGDYTYLVAVNRRAYDPECPTQTPVPGCENHLQPVGTNANLQLTGNFVGPVEVLGESRQVSLVSGSFSDSFDPLGVHLYRVYTDRTPPTAAITSPVPGAIFKRNKPASITVSVSDAVGANQITLTITGPSGTTLTQTISPAQTSAVRTFTWTPTVNGSYTLRATARDVFNQTGNSATVTVSVTNTGT